MAELLYHFYLFSCVFQLVWSVATVLTKDIVGIRQSFRRFPATYWFWGLVLYFCPADDCKGKGESRCVEICSDYKMCFLAFLALQPILPPPLRQCGFHC
jgi:hypothetical protein